MHPIRARGEDGIDLLPELREIGGQDGGGDDGGVHGRPVAGAASAANGGIIARLGAWVADGYILGPAAQRPDANREHRDTCFNGWTMCGFCCRFRCRAGRLMVEVRVNGSPSPGLRLAGPGRRYAQSICGWLVLQAGRGVRR